jgi:hypothetical protein
MIIKKNPGKKQIGSGVTKPRGQRLIKQYSQASNLFQRASLSSSDADRGGKLRSSRANSINNIAPSLNPANKLLFNPNANQSANYPRPSIINLNSTGNDVKVPLITTEQMDLMSIKTDDEYSISNVNAISNPNTKSLLGVKGAKATALSSPVKNVNFYFGLVIAYLFI